VVQKLKEVKKAIKEWRKNDSVSTKSTILSLRQRLKAIQESLGTDTCNTHLQQQEKDLKIDLHNWLAMMKIRSGKK